MYEYTNIRTCTDIRTNELTYVQTDNYTNIRKNEHTNTRTYIRTNLRTYGHTDIRTHELTDIRTYEHTNGQPDEHTDIRTYGHANGHTNIRTYERTNLRTYEHSIICTYVRHLTAETFESRAKITSAQERGWTGAVCKNWSVETGSLQCISFGKYISTILVKKKRSFSTYDG